MAAPAGPQPVSVTGGSAGIAARTQEIRALAGQFGAAATETLGAAWTLHGYLVHPALTGSALLDPVGYATFEADLLTALDGVHGLTVVGGRCGLLDGELRLAAAGYEAVDHLAGALHDDVLGVVRLPVAVASGGVALSGGAGTAGALQSVIAADPDLADTVVDALGLPGAITLGATVLPDGHGVARPLGVDRTGLAGAPPRHLTDVIGELSQRNGDTHHGAVDVRILTLADGSRRVIVDITGTKSWTPLPTTDITSLTTNGRALIGEPTAYEQGVLAAMRRAGVRHSDQVMIVGHSEGGMVAVTTARDAVRSGEFDVTHVVTAGSPVGRTVAQLPRSVRVLALENTRDVVPHLDGVANPDLPSVTTARAAHGDGTVTDDHSLDDAYVPLARDVEASSQASLRDFRRGIGSYLRATSVRTHTFQIVRRYP